MLVGVELGISVGVSDGAIAVGLGARAKEVGVGTAGSEEHALINNVIVPANTRAIRLSSIQVESTLTKFE